MVARVIFNSTFTRDRSARSPGVGCKERHGRHRSGMTPCSAKTVVYKSLESFHEPVLPKEKNVLGGSLLAAATRHSPGSSVTDAARRTTWMGRAPGLHQGDRGVSRFSRSRGNDLSTPRPECASRASPRGRWAARAALVEATRRHGAAGVLESTHENVLKYVPSNLSRATRSICIDPSGRTAPPETICNDFFIRKQSGNDCARE